VPTVEPTTDAIAREAARRLVLGLDPTLAAAIDAAAEAAAIEVERRRRAGLDLAAPDRPSFALVRRHHEAMQQQALGLEGHADEVRAMLQVALDLMELLETHLELGATRLAGRAARGRLDPDLVLHLRLYGDAGVGTVAAGLVEHGTEEPVFRTVRTRFGRLERLEFTDEGWPISLVLLPPARLAEAGRNLYRDEPVAVLGIAEVRRRVEGTAAE